jgi:hypothetical protein
MNAEHPLNCRELVSSAQTAGDIAKLSTSTVTGRRYAPPSAGVS